MMYLTHLVFKYIYIEYGELQYEMSKKQDDNKRALAFSTSRPKHVDRDQSQLHVEVSLSTLDYFRVSLR